MSLTLILVFGKVGDLVELLVQIRNHSTQKVFADLRTNFEFIHWQLTQAPNSRRTGFANGSGGWLRGFATTLRQVKSDEPELPNSGPSVTLSDWGSGYIHSPNCFLWGWKILCYLTAGGLPCRC